MTREMLDRNIRTLKSELLALESMVKEATLGAVASLVERDYEASKRIHANDQRINRRRFDIELDCLITIATQQPIARDLRVLASILEVASELERMGDYAKGIAKVNELLGPGPIPASMTDLTRMAEITVGMLEKAIKAFAEQDEQSARSIPGEDDAVDDLFNKIYHELVEEMISNPKIAERANHLQWAAHNLERMADRVTNICERTIFVVTGEIRELDSSDDELYRNREQQAE